MPGAWRKTNWWLVGFKMSQTLRYALGVESTSQGGNLVELLGRYVRPSARAVPPLGVESRVSIKTWVAAGYHGYQGMGDTRNDQNRCRCRMARLNKQLMTILAAFCLKAPPGSMIADWSCVWGRVRSCN